MPRDVPLGNGSLLVAFDHQYQIRDLYWPHVGQENHAMGHPFRVGVWVDNQFRWLDDDKWQRQLRYGHDTLVTDVKLHHPDLNITLEFNDAVDFHEDLLVRRLNVTDDSNNGRTIRLFFHQDFHILGNEFGDTAYYEPDRRAIIHYKDDNWFLINGGIVLEDGDAGPGWPPTADTKDGLVVGIHQWACGLKEIRNLEGTWRDAEDGQLSGNAVAHGSVDSTVGFELKIPAHGARTLYYWMAIGRDFESVARINRNIRERGPQVYLDRTAAYWNLWLKKHILDEADIPHEVLHEYAISLLVVRTQIDNGGAVIAANDSDVSSDVRDTYSYMWPRDGSLVTNAMILSNGIDLSRKFFEFCTTALTHEGYLLHKYNPDGTLASSWHPWYRDGKKEIPIQEDETALVLWVLWKHFEQFGDVEFIKPLYRTLIRSMGDFLSAHRDAQTGLPIPSYDLWEERHGILSWTVAATWAGLDAAARFTESFGDDELAARYRKAADEIKAGADAQLWRPELKRFVRMINPTADGKYEIDPVIDSSLAGLWQFGMYAPEDPKIVQTMEAIRDRLWVKTNVGGVARYENDRYHQVSQDIQNIPGNPWFICTLWLSEWYAATARAKGDLQKSLDLIHWVVDHALPSGILAEQVNPFTDEPLSVSPLTWSHAAFVTTVHAYLDAKDRLQKSGALSGG
ncbi:MAG: glycoside hydrolase family 15 protein [Chloroflexi bacterium]|nr:glycoside hydrolase family 15 protein [Chloroflexota bacterium]